MAKEMEIYGAGTLSAFEYLANKDVENNTAKNSDKEDILTFEEFMDTSAGKHIKRIKVIFKVDDEKNVVVLTPKDEAYSFITTLVENVTKLPFKATRAAEVLELAPTEISNIKRKDRVITANMVLRMFLLADKLPAIKEINHALMAMNLPGLYLSTFFKDVNVKNAILTSAFEFMALEENKALDGNTRIKLVNTLFRKHDYECYFKKYGCFTKEEVEDSNIRNLIEKAFVCSEELIKQVKEAEHENVRLMVLEKYAAANNIDISTARVRVQRCFKHYSASFKNHLFSYSEKNMGTREQVIDLGKYMECNFYDMTRLLIDANHPMIYWNREEDHEIITATYGKN